MTSHVDGSGSRMGSPPLVPRRGRSWPQTGREALYGRRRRRGLRLDGPRVPSLKTRGPLFGDLRLEPCGGPVDAGLAPMSEPLGSDDAADLRPTVPRPGTDDGRCRTTALIRFSPCTPSRGADRDPWSASGPRELVGTSPPKRTVVVDADAETPCTADQFDLLGMRRSDSPIAVGPCGARGSGGCRATTGRSEWSPGRYRSS